MPDNQPFMFFASGDDAGRLEASPSVAAVTARGFDVLLCPEGIDELTLMTLREYAGAPIKNVTTEDLGLVDLADIEFAKRINDENAALFRAIKESLPDDVVEVKATTRMFSVPACITAKGPVSLGMEKYFASLPNEAGGRPQIQHALELNPHHRVFETLKHLHDGGDVESVRRYATVLHGQALLAEGLPIADLTAYSKAVYELM